MKCGLLGRALGHSYSPEIHRHLGDYAYGLYEVEPEELASFLAEGSLSGMNVTIPYKKAVIPYLAKLTPQAMLLNAVNTIVRSKDGKLIGHNTDYYGFLSLMNRTGLDVAGKKALVLGSGGASATAVAVLSQLGARVIVISRSGENHYGNLELHKDAQLLVNTTPVGMYPNCGSAPVDLTRFPSLLGVIDVIYNPARTRLLLDAQAQDIPCFNGLWMLVAQAKEAAQWFTGQSISDAVLEPIYHALNQRMQNIVLIGMPGCGKSTIGALLAEKTGRPFFDADERIVSLAGKSIPRIFEEDGEAVFRSWETKALEELGKQSGILLATGGGCVTQRRNYNLLAQNGRLFWLQRELSLLPKEGRPLSKTCDLTSMYEKRGPLYQSFADHIVDNSQQPEVTANRILKHWEECL